MLPPTQPSRRRTHDLRPSLPSTRALAAPSCVFKQHTEAEWAAAYPHIERLYLSEGRKLRHVKAIMEGEYQFKASPQMYKKRFAKWGFHKNARHFRPVRNLMNPINLPQTPETTNVDAYTLSLFTAISQWTSAFFQSPDLKQSLASGGVWNPGPIYTPSRRGPALLYDPERVSHAFRLVAKLLNDGHGVLAGRLARKAFIQVEDMMLIEGPSFIWNLLDIMHAILHMGQAKLFHMLLVHLTGLSDAHQHVKNHPADMILRCLMQLTQHWCCESGAEYFPTSNHMLLVVERGWFLNAAIVLDNFDARLLLLYNRLMWNSTPCVLPEDKLRTVDLWFSLLDDKVPLLAAALQNGNPGIDPDIESFGPTDGKADDRVPDYDSILDTTEAALQARYEAAGVSLQSKVRLVQGLIKSRLAEGREGILTKTTKPSASNAHRRPFFRILAFAAKILMEVDVDLGGNIDIAIDRLRGVIALREYGQDANEPTVILDLGLLEVLLLKNGSEVEAHDVRLEALRRLGVYVEGVLSSV